MASNDEDKHDPPTTAGDGAAGGSSDDSPPQVDFLSSLLSKFTFKHAEPEPKPKPEKLLEELTIESVAKYLKSEKCKNVVVMVGAGISTSAGIPDFRSPGSGLYDNLQQYNLPSPESIFEIGYFMEHPEPFFKLAKQLYPGTFKPTPCHYFIRLLAQKGKLLRLYSQNIDTLERIAGVPGDLIVEAHGTFHTGHCLGDCKKEYTQEWMKNEIFKDMIPRCPDCEGLVKPDIVFFGEGLPKRFFSSMEKDFPSADLLIVMGTSLKVQPFASLVDRVNDTTPRLLINLEKCGAADPFMKMLGLSGGMDFESENNYRDVAEVSTCDDGCYKLAALLGWKGDLDKLIKTEHDKIDRQTTGKAGETKKTPSSGELTDNQEDSEP
ncbi:NAD-dependent protein deacetylase sirtuin-2-like isoform X2 [Antedon mediterranea]|uniref:NAD-dependent protein deacetylase sirtuin-2-like isoform X2 n=1 Tax=Antedon mediterranea TaxID=105859 RepID=UPI003AF73461